MPFHRLFACAAILALGLPAVAGINTFTPTGPDGGATYDVAFAGGGALLTTTTRAIYRSTDGGANWTRSRAIENWGPQHLAVNPANRNQVLFGAAFELVRSTDGGATWSQVPNFPDLQTNPIGLIQFSPDGSVVWIAKQNGGTLYRSTDAGATWTSINTGLAYPIISIAADSANPQRIYVRTPDGAFLSTDGGATFTPLTVARYLGPIGASRTTANTVLAASSDDYRFYLSTDGGANWAQTAWPPTPGRQVWLVQYVPGTPGKAIAMDSQFRLLRTLDDGQHWTDLGFAPNGEIYGIAFHPTDPTHILLATFGGVFESTDDGATWVERTRGLREGNVRSVVASRAGAGATYLQSWDLASVYVRATDTGAWSPVGRASTPLLGFPASRNSISGYYSLGVSRQNPQLLYMSRDGMFGVSSDGGVTWGLRAPVQGMENMEVSPANDQVLLMGGVAQPPVRSINGGMSWTSLSANGLPPGVRHFAFDPVNTNVVYAAVDNYVPPAATAVYKSVDGGANFAPAGWNTTHNPSIVWRLVHDPSRTNIAYLSAFHGVYKTTDGGATWTPQPLFNDNQISGGAVDLIIDPQSPDILYASAYQRPWLARSVNGGASWDVIQESYALEQFSSIALVPGSRTKIIAVRRAASSEIDFAVRLSAGVAPLLATVNTATSSVMTIANRGGLAASAVRLTATLPASSTTHTIQSTSGTCSVTGAVLSCEFGILPANAQTSVTVGYTPTTVGAWSAALASYEPDDDVIDNTVLVAVSAPAPPRPGGGGGGGGGNLDYLLLALLGALQFRGAVRRH